MFLTPPMDFEERVQRISFYFGMRRSDVLWDLTMAELLDYNNKALYFFLESQGKAPKKSTTDQDKDFQSERKARLKKIYGED